VSTIEPMFKSLLPTREEEHLKRVDYVAEDIFFRLDTQRVTLLPEKTPKSVLPHLAYMFGVSLKELSEKEQRELVAVSQDIYRYIGTPYALKRAFKSINKEIEIVEWYESRREFRPYEFGVKLKKLDAKGAVFYIDFIKRFKNERSWLKQLSDGSCQGRVRLDNSKLDSAVLENVEGVEVLGVKVCFKTMRTTMLQVAPVTIENYYVRERVYALRMAQPHILKNSEKIKQRFYTLERTWTGAWNSSRWDNNKEWRGVWDATTWHRDHDEIVGRMKTLEKQKSAKPNAYWNGEWSDARAWSDSYKKAKELTKTRGLLIDKEPELKKERTLKKNMTLKRVWLGEWNHETWNENYTIQGVRYVSI